MSGAENKISILIHRRIGAIRQLRGGDILQSLQGRGWEAWDDWGHNATLALNSQIKEPPSC